MGCSNAQTRDVVGQTYCWASCMFSMLHKHGWPHSPAPGWEREQDDQRSSHEQGQGLNSAKLHQQQTAVMQKKLFCISTAVTVRRAQTSHPPCVWHSAWPPLTPCLASECRHLDTAVDDRHLAPQKCLQRGWESVFSLWFWLYSAN